MWESAVWQGWSEWGAMWESAACEDGLSGVLCGRVLCVRVMLVCRGYCVYVDIGLM